MRIVAKQNVLVVVGETPEEIEQLARWKLEHADCVFYLAVDQADHLSLKNLGPQPIACREPINISSNVADPRWQLISNLAQTPFVLDGQAFASVEGFWQGLKFDDDLQRRHVATLHGKEAKHAGDVQGYADVVHYGGEAIPVGTWRHWQLMQAACTAKFQQHQAAREALLSTDPRPLTHRMRRDSRTIPGAIMAEIWLHLRQKLASC